jgi:hypothetical protein
MDSRVHSTCAVSLQALSSDSAVATEPHVDYLDHCHVASPVEPSFNPAASASRAEGRMEQQDAEGVVLKLYNTEGLQSAAQRTGLEQGPLQVPHVRKDKRSDKVRMLLMRMSGFPLHRAAYEARNMIQNVMTTNIHV